MIQQSDILNYLVDSMTIHRLVQTSMENPQIKAAWRRRIRMSTTTQRRATRHAGL